MENAAGGGLIVRRLEEAGIPFAMELKAIAGWNQTEQDWRRYIRLEPEGCFLAYIDGEPAGTGTALAYGGVGWIGMILVHPDKRRFGIGTAMLRRTIGYLRDRGVRSVKLDATPMGKKVYIPLGFVDEYDVRRYESPPDFIPQAIAAGGENGHEAAPLEASQLAAFAAYDAEVFGVPRPAVLEALCADNPGLSFGLRDTRGHIVGYALARRGSDAIQVGPWAANGPTEAETLFRAILSSAGDSRLFLDVPETNPDGLALMEKYGFRIQRGFCRMYLGENRHPGTPGRVYATSGAEKG